MKFAFITPRYGAEVGGEAERACRLLAEQLSRRHDVDVLTTTARDAATWRGEYAEGADRVRRVLVRRFAVSPGHDRTILDQLDRQLRTAPRTRDDERAWVRAHGPASAGLADYLRRQHDTYDALAFFGLWHPLTVTGLEIAPRRSLLFPCARPGPALRFELWADLLTAAAGVGFFSDAERRLVLAYAGVTPRHVEVVGIGVDPPSRQSYPRHQQDPADAIVADDVGPSGEEDEEAPADYLSAPGVPFRRRHRLYGDFALYSGRVEADNGSEELIDYYDSYAAGGDDLPLVLMGVKLLKVPDAPYLRLSGVVPDRERMTAYEAAAVTIAPGVGDLLAQSTLESLAVGTPVLASARNPAAVAHCREAAGGLFYADRDEFVEALATLSRQPDLRRRLGESGRRYVRQHHEWDAVVGRFERLVGRGR